MTTQVPVAPATRQPFAPLNQSRLQTLTSIKNRQNAISTSPSKRKAEFYDFDNEDSENIDPVFSTSPKRSKAVDGTNALFKPSQFILTNAPPSPNDQTSPFKPSVLSSTKTRTILRPRSPLKISSPKAPLSAPAGRSPTRKRVGILNRRRTGGSPNAFTRVDPPAFSLGAGKSTLGSGLPFTIDAALKGTIPSYARRNTPKPAAPAPTPSSQSSSSQPTTSLQPDLISIPQLYQPSPKSSWFFEIHEDTVEEENTNLMYHSTCTLDISSDEESLSRSRIRDLQNKENVPPMNDQSQTSYRQQHESTGLSTKSKLRGRKEKDPDACDIDREPLGEMAAEDFFAEGCNRDSAWVVLEDVYEEEIHEDEEAQVSCAIPEESKSSEQAITTTAKFDYSTIPQIRVNEEGEGKAKSVEELMRIGEKETEEGPPARVLEPIEKAEEGWKIWESGSVSGGE